MKRIVVAATLTGMGLVWGDAAPAQEWGGVAGIAASRGYMAAPGLSSASYDAPTAPAAPPADAEALAATAPAPARVVPVVDLAGVAAHRRPSGAVEGRAGAKVRHGRRHLGRV